MPDNAPTSPPIIVKLAYYPHNSNTPKYAARRAFYASNIKDDYMRYIDKAEANPDYLSYSGNEEKSHGVFSQNGLLSKKEKTELRKALQETKSVIWDLLISFEEDYGIKHVNRTDDARKLLSSTLPAFFKKAGLNPDNVIWFAGLHENTENRHCHVSFFEKLPLSYRREDMTTKRFHRGQIPQTAIDGFKLKLEQTLSDPDFNIGVHRNKIMEELSPSLDPDNLNRWLKAKLLAIAKRLPSSGRLSYDSDNMRFVRPLIDEVTVRLLSGSTAYTKLKQDLFDFDELTKERCHAQNIENIPDYFLTDKVIFDLYCRLGNKVIKLAKEIKTQKQFIRSNKHEHTKIWRRGQRKKLHSILDCCRFLYEDYEQDCTDAFNEYIRKLRKFEKENEEEPEYELEREEMEM